ncbi:MAG: leucine--tRNA ligase [Patescibacteria group bacterium]
MTPYDHKKIEEKWKSHWTEDNIYEAVDFSDKPKKYILAELPYPSGSALHIGHVMRYTLPDVYSRYLRMNGYNVMFPMGWDSFGLPGEHFAIQEGKHPSKLIDETVEYYRESVQRMGYGVDWNREIKTTDPKYYKWTQWLFLKLFKEGLAEYRKMPVWWCDELKSVLADEEVVNTKDGIKVSEKGNYPVERKMFSQWVLKIPQYAEKLIQGLNEVDFPDSIRNAQINWIGKSEGVAIKFKSDDIDFEVFTTRPDTLYGITFMAFAPEHPLIIKFLEKTENKDEVKKYIQKTMNKSDLERQTLKEKTGVELKGIEVEVPLTGKKVPVFIADYVIMDYGTGILMGVPAHDTRDFEFADKFDLEVIKVIEPAIKQDMPFVDEGTVINSGDYNGMNSKDFAKKITEDLEKQGLGKPDVQYNIRDWVFSRQRYWGEPIPLVHLEDGSIKPICDPDNPKEVETYLPLNLPVLEDYTPTEDGSSPLERDQSWINTKIDGKEAKRETSTMPTWAGSCWYYIRYIDAKNDKEFADFEKLKYWLPVDKYFGGAEHTTMHLLYSRFWHKFLYDQKLVPTPEPYQWRLNGGLMLGVDGKKMSKSRGNVVEPMEVVDEYGADALRMTVLFLGPYEDVYPWNPRSITALSKFISTVYSLKDKISEAPATPEAQKAFHKMLKNVTGMIENLKMNTCVSEFMIFLNSIKSEKDINKDVYLNFIKVLAPFAPFMCEEVWQELNEFKNWDKENSVHIQEWPKFNEKLTKDNVIILPIQVNGKVRSEIEIKADESEEKVKEMVLSDEKIQKYLDGKNPKQVIYVKNRIINIVT